MQYCCDGLKRDTNGQTLREPTPPGKAAKYGKAIRQHEDKYGYAEPGNCPECGYKLTEYIDVW